MRTRPVLPLLAAAVFGLAACGGGSDDASPDSIASLGTVADASSGDGSDDAGDAPETTIDPQDAALEFARCMREHGVDMPDPTADGGITIGVSSDEEAEAMAQAQEACAPIMEELRNSFEPPSPEEIEKMKEQTLAYAQCMREHGIDMPDPIVGEDGMVQMTLGGPDGDQPEYSQEEMEAASEACAMDGAGVAIAARPIEGDRP